MDNFGADPRKYNRLKRAQESGYKVKLLEDEPAVTDYENEIVQAATMCETVSDFIAWGELIRIPHLPIFVRQGILLKRQLDLKAIKNGRT